MTNKVLLRSQFLQKREKMSEVERREKSLLISQQVKSFLHNNAIQTVHTFLPQRGKNEVDTYNIISMIRESFPYVQVIVPRIITGTRNMEHYLLEQTTILIENKWKIPEPDPATTQQVNVINIDAVLIPLLAFDKSGYRVGYGGGFYDRFLSLCRPDTVKAGLSFFDPVEEITDTE